MRSSLREPMPEHPNRWMLPNVPVIPISARNARTIFERMEGDPVRRGQADLFFDLPIHTYWAL